MSNCINDRRVVAKRPHTRRCGLCDGTILVGDRLRRYSYADGGVIESVVEHQACAAVAGRYCEGQDEWYHLDGEDEHRDEAMRLLAEHRVADGVSCAERVSP